MRFDELFIGNKFSWNGKKWQKIGVLTIDGLDGWTGTYNAIRVEYNTMGKEKFELDYIFAHAQVGLLEQEFIFDIHNDINGRDEFICGIIAKNEGEALLKYQNEYKDQSPGLFAAKREMM